MLASGFLLLGACGEDEKPAPGRPESFGAGSLRLSWVKNVEFAGSYVADTNGYYTAEGFSSFELIGGGPTATPAETDLVSGKALVGLSVPDRVAAAVLKGAELKIIGAQFQKNPFAILSMADNPI